MKKLKFNLFSVFALFLFLGFNSCKEEVKEDKLSDIDGDNEQYKLEEDKNSSDESSTEPNIEDEL